MNYKHGYRSKKYTYRYLYNIWINMHRRCENPNYINYHRYGGRGVRVSSVWNRYEPFREWSLKHGYKHGLCIDRIDNDGGYYPENCRWVTHSANHRNRSNNTVFTINGISRTLVEWSEIVGLSDLRQLLKRLECGWTIEEACTIPAGTKRSSFYKKAALS